MNSPDVAERFASALDADDFLEAAHLLEEDCLYSTHEEKFEDEST